MAINTTNFNIQNEEEQMKQYYSTFTDSIYNLFYLGENDYDDAYFIGSFTNFENLSNYVKKEYNRMEHTHFDYFPFMIKVSRVNGEYFHENYLTCLKKDGKNKIFYDHRFCDKIKSCLLSAPEIFTIHPDYKFCCECQLYKPSHLMNDKHKNYCNKHNPL